MSETAGARPPREIEFKFAVDSADAFALLLAHLGEPPGLLERGVVQVNHFFDTPGFDLGRNGSIVRLRAQRGEFQLTVKGHLLTEGSDKVLTQRVEYEAPLARAVATSVLDRGAFPLDLLAHAMGRHADAVRSMLKQYAITTPLACVGHFTNTRVKLPVSLHGLHGRFDLLLELDSSRFPNGIDAWEIEVEIADLEQAGAIQAALEKLLADAGIDWHTTSNKAVRFFAALGHSWARPG